MNTPPPTQQAALVSLGKTSLKRKSSSAKDSPEDTQILKKSRNETPTRGVVKIPAGGSTGESYVPKEKPADSVTFHSMLSMFDSFAPKHTSHSPQVTSTIPTLPLTVKAHSRTPSPPPPPPPPPPSIATTGRIEDLHVVPIDPGTFPQTTLPDSYTNDSRQSFVTPQPTVERSSSITPTPMSPFTMAINSLESQDPAHIATPTPAQKEYIIKMHLNPSRPFLPGEIQRGFFNLHHVLFSLEAIESVIAEYQNSIAASDEIPSLDQARSRSSSTTPSTVPGSTLDVKTEAEVPQLPSAPNISIRLDDLSAEERLKQLESLQAELPNMIERARQLISEERRKEREEQARKEQQELEKILANIKEKEGKIAKLKDESMETEAEVEKMKDILRQRELRRRQLLGLEEYSFIWKNADTRSMTPESEPTVISPVDIQGTEETVIKPEAPTIDVPMHSPERESFAEEEASALEATSSKNDNGDYETVDMEIDPALESKAPHTESTEASQKEEQSVVEHPIEGEKTTANHDANPASTVSSLPVITMKISDEKKSFRPIEIPQPPNKKWSIFDDLEQTQEIPEREVPRIFPPTPEQATSHTDPFEIFFPASTALRLGNHTIGGSNTPRRSAPDTDRSLTKKQVVLPIAYKDVSPPATHLLTNSYRDWSDFCVALGADGNIDLINSKFHRSADPKTFIWQEQYTSSCAINGAWIGPGELALVDKDSRRNRNKSPITLIKYTDPQLSARPQVIPLRDSPHSLHTKVTAIAPLWIKNDKKTFATGGMNPLNHY